MAPRVGPATGMAAALDPAQRRARHRSGFARGFPRIVRLRPDKPVSDIDTLDTVRSIVEPGAGAGAGGSAEPDTGGG